MIEIEAEYSDNNNRKHPFLNISGGHAYGSHYVMSVIVPFSIKNEVLIYPSYGIDEESEVEFE